MIQKKLIVTFVVAISVFTAVFVIGTKLIIENCGWSDSHLNHLCGIIPDPTITAAILGGAVFGWKQKLNISIFGFLVPIIGLLIIWVFGYASHYIGSAFGYGFISLVLSCAIQGFLSSVAFSALSNEFWKV